MSDQQKITSATPEQWEQIDQIREAYINRQTDQLPLDKVVDAVSRMWISMGEKAPMVLQAASPIAALQLTRDTLRNTFKVPEEELKTLVDLPKYWSIWWQAWTGWYEGAEVLGVKLDQEKLSLMKDWTKYCPFVVPLKGLVVVSQNPVAIHWQDSELHCEDGPSVRYSDGFCIWSIEGVSVDEQIVLKPETQTIQQITDEENEEVRRIRIDRYGWMRYLEESGASVVACGKNKIERTYEVLANTPIGQRLVTVCPSTGRKYSLGIPGEKVKSCAEAQQRLWGDRNVTIIGRT